MRRVSFVLLAAIAAGSVLAESSIDQDSVQLEQVVVTATRSEMALDRLPANAIVIDRAAIEPFAGAGLPDVLRYHAGLDIATNGGPGAAASLFLRGTESNHVLVLIDGVEMNPGSIGGAALQHIPLASIERVEIIKGPRSALYGSEAIGGVINIITRRGDDERVSFAATGGSFATRELDAAYFGAAGGWHYGAELGRRESDGFPPRAGSDIERGYERDQVNAFAGWRGETTFIEARHWRSEGVSEYLGFFLEPLSQSFANRTSSIDLRHAFGDTWSARLLLGNARDEIRQQQANFLGAFDYVTTDRDTADMKIDYHAWENRTFTTGLYVEDADVNASSYAATEDVKALYLQDVYADERNSTVAAVRVSDYEAFGNELTWNAGWTRSIGENHSAFVSAGTAFRAPDATDRFGFGGNPDLEAETSRTLEFGYRHAVNERQTISATVFRTDIDDLIAYVDPDGFEGPDPGGNRNIDEARIDGFELAHEWQGENWRWRAEAILQDPRDVATDSQLARRAKRSITVNYVRQLGAVEVGLNGLATGSRPDSPFTTDVLPGYGILGASLGWRIDSAWLLNLRIENLTDRDYQTAAGYNSAERSYFLSLRYSR